jgi:hypothetical protein
MYKLRLRGAMGSVELFVEFFGYLAGLMIGSLVNIHIMPWITVCPCLIFLAFSWYVIESPGKLFNHQINYSISR